MTDIHTQIDGLRAGRYTHLAAQYDIYKYHTWNLANQNFYLWVPPTSEPSWTPQWSVSARRDPPNRSALCESEEEAEGILCEWIAEDLRVIQYPTRVDDLIRRARDYGVPVPDTVRDSVHVARRVAELRATMDAAQSSIREAARRIQAARAELRRLEEER